MDTEKLREAAVMAGVATFAAIIIAALLTVVGMVFYVLFAYIPIPALIILGFFLLALAVFYFKPDLPDVIERLMVGK